MCFSGRTFIMAGMPKIAILSDVHSNLPALTAVLEDIRKSGITEIYCGGDTVGYAAQPDECVELLREHGVRSVLGNHDFYTNEVIADPENIPPPEVWMQNPVWAGVVHSARALKPENARWLADLPEVLKIPEAVLSHASLHFREEWPYLHSFGDAAPTLDILQETGDMIGFFGHTHQQNYFSHRVGTALVKRLGFSRVMLPEGVVCAVMIGSVGQPREDDLRAAWVIWDPENRVVEFRKTEYDAFAAARRIIDAGLPHSSAVRLLDHAAVRRLRAARRR